MGKHTRERCRHAANGREPQSQEVGRQEAQRRIGGVAERPAGPTAVCTASQMPVARGHVRQHRLSSRSGYAWGSCLCSVRGSDR